MLAFWTMEIKVRNRLKGNIIKEEKDHSHSQQIKLNNFTVSLWAKRREKLIQSQLPLRLDVMPLLVECIFLAGNHKMCV